LHPEASGVGGKAFYLVRKAAGCKRKVYCPDRRVSRFATEASGFARKAFGRAGLAEKRAGEAFCAACTAQNPDRKALCQAFAPSGVAVQVYL
jgi:hypothetical protein